MRPNTSDIHRPRQRVLTMANLVLFAALTLTLLSACGGGSISIVQSGSAAGPGDPCATQIGSGSGATGSSQEQSGSATGPGAPCATQSGSGSGSGVPSTPQPPSPPATQTLRSGTVPLLTEKGTSTLPDGSPGIVRLTGDNPKWSQVIPTPTSYAGATLTGLQLVIETGGDDLRGDSNNAWVVIHYVNAGDVTYLNINQSQHWNNYETHTVALIPVPNATTLGDVQNITIEADLSGQVGGAPSGDNWDIGSAILYATFQQ